MYFPWKALDENKVLPVEAPDPDKQNALYEFFADLANFDFDAEIRVDLVKWATDPMPRFTVTGPHDLFPAYEVYVNGQEAYVWGTVDDLAGRPLDYALNQGRDIVPREPRPVKILK